MYRAEDDLLDKLILDDKPPAKPKDPQNKPKQVNKGSNDQPDEDSDYDMIDQLGHTPAKSNIVKSDEPKEEVKLAPNSKGKFYPYQ